MNKKEKSKAAAPMPRYGRAERVAELLDVTKGTIWRWAKEGALPAPRYIGPKTPVWDLDEVIAVLDKRSREAASS